jgi:hypothetical protein
MKNRSHAGLGWASGANEHRRLPLLREAIRNREVTFPAQVPSFPQQYGAEAQWRLVTLYFVRGWTSEQLAGRYRVTTSRVRQLLRHWVDCATRLGYVQEIPAENEFVSSPPVRQYARAGQESVGVGAAMMAH